MMLPILSQTAREADPRRNYRMRDFLETLGLRPTFVPETTPEPVKGADPGAEVEAPAAAEPEAPEAEAGSEDEVPAGEVPELEPYTLNSIAVPAKDEPAEAEAEAGQ